MDQNVKIYRMARRPLIAATVAMTAATTLAVTAQPAQASTHRPCTIVKHSTTNGVTKLGTATATVGADGIKLTTAQNTNVDKVTWRETIRPIPANTLNELTYETVKLDQTAGDNNVVNDAALPSYHIYVKTPAGEGTLVYEPYWYLSQNGLGTPQRQVRTEWNVLQGKLWTSSNVITGLPPMGGGPPAKTFAEIVAANPKMVVTGYGFGLGTYNAGTIAVLDEQRFATKTSCSEHQWSTGFRNNVWWPGWLR